MTQNTIQPLAAPPQHAHRRIHRRRLPQQQAHAPYASATSFSLGPVRLRHAGALLIAIDLSISVTTESRALQKYVFAIFFFERKDRSRPERPKAVSYRGSGEKMASRVVTVDGIDFERACMSDRCQEFPQIHSVHQPFGTTRRVESCSCRPCILIVGLLWPLRKISVICPQPLKYKVFKL
jgi:hypothetical protein